jgi:hypothetical protein
VWRIEDWKYAPLGFGSWSLACTSALDNKVVRVGVRVTGLGQPDAVFEIVILPKSLRLVCRPSRVG